MFFIFLIILERLEFVIKDKFYLEWNFVYNLILIYLK